MEYWLMVGLDDEWWICPQEQHKALKNNTLFIRAHWKNQKVKFDQILNKIPSVYV